MDPHHVVIAGDWHGNTDWARQVVEALPDLLPEEEEPLILQLGDFGIWPGHEGSNYTRALAHALDLVNGRLWFVHGNHENHASLAQRYDHAQRGRIKMTQGRIPITASRDPRIHWLPTNTRWSWHNKTWAAVGGAVSVDRALRTEGVDWWAGEELSEAQAQQVMAAGPVDVVAAHDCPAEVELGLPPVPPSFGWAPRDLFRSEAHRERLQRVVDAVKPALVMHGHYHPIPDGRQHTTTVPMEHGPVQVGWFDRDGQPDNYRVLDVVSLSWLT